MLLITHFFLCMCMIGPLLLQSTSLNKADISIDCDFLPIVKEVLGRVPETLAAQAAAMDEADRQQQQQQQPADSAAAAEAGEGSSNSSNVPDDYLPGVPRPLAAAVDAALKLDDETLAAVSRAIMGRLDIVDLVGKNTAYEVAERVSVLLFVLRV
jgi:cell division protease FtsH